MLVAVRELKAAFSRLLSLALAGEFVAVTSQNKAITRIADISAPSGHGVIRLIVAGVLSWKGERPLLAPAPTLASACRTLSQTVLEDRG